MPRRLALVALVAAAFWSICYLWLSADGNVTETASPSEGHFRSFNLADITPQRVESLHESLRGHMADRYAEAAEPSARNYQNWQRFNSAPYQSYTHGGLFVNDYGGGGTLW